MLTTFHESNSTSLLRLRPEKLYTYFSYSFFFSFLSDALQNDQKGRKSGSPLKQGVFRPVNLAKSTLDWNTALSI